MIKIVNFYNKKNKNHAKILILCSFARVFYILSLALTYLVPIVFMKPNKKKSKLLMRIFNELCIKI